VIQIPNLVAVFQLGTSQTLRLEVFKTDGDLSASFGPHNRYVYLDGQLRLIASIWDKQFLRFEDSTNS